MKNFWRSMMSNIIEMKRRTKDIEKELQAKKGTAHPTDVYDKEGNFKKIDFHNGAGNFILEAVWDERDAQNEENRLAFKKWAYNMMRQKGYSIDLPKKEKSDEL